MGALEYCANYDLRPLSGFGVTKGAKVVGRLQKRRPIAAIPPAVPYKRISTLDNRILSRLQRWPPFAGMPRPRRLSLVRRLPD